MDRGARARRPATAAGDRAGTRAPLGYRYLRAELGAWGDASVGAVGVLRYERLDTCACRTVLGFGAPAAATAAVDRACASFGARARRLNYHATTTRARSRPVAFEADDAGFARVLGWRRVLDGGLADVSRVETLDGRTSALGYSLLEPTAHWDPASNRTVDAFRRWQLAPAARSSGPRLSEFARAPPPETRGTP